MVTIKKSVNLNSLTLGVCYYPEHWDEKLWPEDLRLMQAHGIQFVRIAEFAWSLLEPVEGTFCFDLWDRFMELVSQTEMRVIFCTPTATPPAWLTQRYPEVLNANMEGQLLQHGMRRHYNYNSAIYQEKTRIIVEQVAQHFAHHPHVIGWQIDNELNCGTNTFYSAADHKAFRIYLQERYKTLDHLNDAWGTLFWNQTYTDWEQVYLPRYTGERKTNNPHMVLDEKRFISHSATVYCKLQYDILRQYVPNNQFITTQGLFDHIDYNDLQEQGADFLTYDSYPGFGIEADTAVEGTSSSKALTLYDRKWSWHLSCMRAFSPNFGVMEQQSGAGGWVNLGKCSAPRPGQMRLWTMQSIAHGADFVSYFRWRTCPFGTEIYWHGILDYANVYNRKLNELGQIKDDIQAVGFLAGAQSAARVAIIRDYDNTWDGEYDIWHGPLRNKSEASWFVALELSHTPFDIVFMNKDTTAEELKKYSLIIYPHATIMDPKRAAFLAGYVEGGGALIMGARSGYKDIHGKCPMMPMPGLLSTLFGVEIHDFTFLSSKDAKQSACWGEHTMTMPIFNDILTPIDATATVLATYQSSYYAGKPALVENSLGQGKAYYYGAAFDADTAALFLAQLGESAPYNHHLSLPPDCELVVRKKHDTCYLFVLNYSDVEQTIHCKSIFVNLLTGKTCKGGVTILPYDVLILQEEKE